MEPDMKVQVDFLKSGPRVTSEHMPRGLLFKLKNVTLEKVRGKLRVTGDMVKTLPSSTYRDRLVIGTWSWELSQVPLKTKAQVPYAVVYPTGVIGIWTDGTE